MPNAINFWLPVNKEAWRNAVTDLLSQAQVAIPTGCALQFNLCFFNDGDLLDLSGYSAVRFSILAPDLSATYIDVTVANTDFETCTTEQFQAFEGQQVQIFIPAAQNILTTTNGAPGNYVLRIYGVDADAASDPDILCLFQIGAYNTGIAQNPQSPIPFKVGTSLPFVCSDGQTRNFSLVKTPQGNWTWTIGAPYNGPGQASYSFLCSDGLYRDMSLAQDSGEWGPTFNQNGHN